MLAVTAVLVAAVNLVMAMDSTPKSLPFKSTRLGTALDMRLKEGTEPVDILFIGNSQSGYNISPGDLLEELGLADQMTGFNLGQGGLTLGAYTSLFVETSEYWNPGTAVFVLGLANVAAESNLELEEEYGWRCLRQELSPPEQLLMRLPLFRYRRQYRELRYQVYLLRTRSPKADLARRLGADGMGWFPGQGGFLERTVIVDAPFSEDSADLLTLSFEAEAFEALKRAVIHAKTIGSTPVLLIPPQPERFFIQYDPKSVQGVLADIARFASEQDVLLIDHARHPALVEDDFFDYTHLKNSSAQKYSRLLAADLAPCLVRRAAEPQLKRSPSVSASATTGVNATYSP
jgi:hypothetical protein